MAASMVRKHVRLVSPRHFIAAVSNVSRVSTVGKFNCLFKDQTFQQHISREFSNGSIKGDSEEIGNQSYGIKRRHVVEKVLTDSDVLVHDRICGLLLGRKRKTLKKFIQESGLRFNVHPTHCDHVLVSGKNDEILKKAVEIVTPHINNLKQEVKNDVLVKVLTDEDTDNHYKICGFLIGKEGENINRLIAEIGQEIRIMTPRHGGHVLVNVKGNVEGKSADVVKIAVEKVTQEIERIKSTIEVSD